LRSGGGKQKGSAYERKICQQLSLWISVGKNKDLFWRSAMSGGRATVAVKKGVSLARQAGDITATAPEGHQLTDLFYIECKFYQNLRTDQFFFKSTGPLANFWNETCKQAEKYGRKPLLIAKQNRLPSLVLSIPGSLPVVDISAVEEPTVHLIDHYPLDCEIRLFDELMEMTKWQNPT